MQNQQNKKNILFFIVRFIKKTVFILAGSVRFIEREGSLPRLFLSLPNIGCSGVAILRLLLKAIAGKAGFILPVYTAWGRHY